MPESPFNEAIDFFRQKVNLPTKTWKDLEGAMHSRAFVVAGAMKEDLLSDFRQSIDKAISQGTTLADFRKDFDSIVNKHGWKYNGGRGWRTRVIYQTNVSTAYMSGRYKQMLDPAVIKHRPYWQYIHSDSSKNPRPEHEAWDGIVLRYDDPWWQTHRPRNGWGCKCSVRTLSKRDMTKLGKTNADKAPAIKIDPKTGIAKGLDVGWDYDPAFGAWGDPVAKAAFRKLPSAKRTSLTSGNFETYSRPKDVPVDSIKTALGASARNQAGVVSALKKTLGTDEKIFTLPDGSRMLVNAEVLGSHMEISRAKFIPFIPDLLNDPFEIWLSFERNPDGRVILRKRLIKGIKLEKDKYMAAIVEAQNGVFTGWTVIPFSKLKEVNKRRKGRLLWGRKD